MPEMCPFCGEDHDPGEEDCAGGSVSEDEDD